MNKDKNVIKLKKYDSRKNLDFGKKNNYFAKTDNFL